ncbi:MAG: hypothetical protein WD847_03760 [Pirellulales bacterium]
MKRPLSTLFSAAVASTLALASPAMAQAQHHGHHGHHGDHGHHGHGHHGHHGYAYGGKLHYGHAGYPIVYGGYHGAYLRGWADVYRSRGLYNLYTSEAAVNFEEARSRRIDNHQKKVETYFALRDLNASYRASQRRPAATPEMVSQWNDSRRPQRLAPEQLEPSLGGIQWPHALTDEAFAASRAALEELYAGRTPSNSGLGSPSASEIKKAARRLQTELNANVKTLSTDEFIQAKKFIDSLAYEARFPVVTEGLASN